MSCRQVLGLGTWAPFGEQTHKIRARTHFPWLLLNFNKIDFSVTRLQDGATISSIHALNSVLFELIAKDRKMSTRPSFWKIYDWTLVKWNSLLIFRILNFQSMDVEFSYDTSKCKIFSC